MFAQSLRNSGKIQPPGHIGCTFCAYTASTQKHKHNATVNFVYLLQRIQDDKHILRQSCKGVVRQVEVPVWEEGETRSGSHPSTPALHERVSASIGSVEVAEKMQLAHTTRENKNPVKKTFIYSPWGICLHVHICKKPFECAVCSLLQVVQSGKHVCRQSR
jgi:hypothetical protein